MLKTVDKRKREYYNLTVIPTKTVGIKIRKKGIIKKIMKLSSKTHYGVQILTIIGTQNRNFSAKELEKYTGVSSKYLEKVLKILLSVGALTATRGANGGYSLAKAPEEIKMGEVVRALEEDNMEIIGCVAKTGCCCPSSALWKKLFEGINEILDGVTLRDIIEGDLK